MTKTAPPPKPLKVNGTSEIFDKEKAIAERIAEIRIRFAKGGFVSRDDKRLAGIEENPDRLSGVVKGYSGVIEYIRQHHGITLTSNMISAWSHGRSLPRGCKVPFPPYEPPNLHRISTFMPWVITHIPKPTDTAKGSSEQFVIRDYVGERQQLAAERERKELLWAEQEKDGKHVLRAEAVAATVGAVQKLHSFVRRSWQRHLKKNMQEALRQRGFTDEQLNAVSEVYLEVGKNILRDVEDQCKKA